MVSLGDIGDGLPETENEVLTALITVKARIAALKLGTPLNDQAWQELRAVLEGTKAIIRPRQRKMPEHLDGRMVSKVAILSQLENEIANFDANQRRAAISIVNGPQRIRGLAGSGKTVVLAMKAAHIHLTNPEANILVTFHTKSLYDFMRRLITRFYRQFNDRDPDWNRVHVRHSWGGRSMEGVYSSACTQSGLTPLNLRDAGGRADPFEYVCDQLVRSGPVKQVYDYVLMDEAQDFPQAFYRLCFRLARGGQHDRNVIWAYDELQNIINVKVAAPAETFGTDDSGVALMDLERASKASQEGMSHDIVLYKCYRNPREILICAHALGFGIYSDTMVQTLENREHWEDLGYQVREGTFEVGTSVVILRPETNSPLAISRSQKPQELIQTFTAKDVVGEVEWITNQIVALIAEGLTPNDIMVICLDDRNARDYFSALSESLDASDIRVNNLLADPYSAPHFVVPEHVTLTTVYRAKGNEAAVVFTIGIDALFPNRKQQRARNKLFTAFTRAKAWLRVSGVGVGAGSFVKEIDHAIGAMPEMRFLQPDPDTILTLQRDLTDKASKLQRLQEEMDKTLSDLEMDEEEREAFLSTLREKI